MLKIFVIGPIDAIWCHGISWFTLCLTTPSQANWCINASVNKATIGSYNGLCPVRHQAIISTNGEWLSFGPLVTYWNQNTKVSINENGFQKLSAKMSSILFWPQGVKKCRPIINGIHLTKGTIDNKLALAHVIMAWCWTCSKPLPEPMMIHERYMNGQPFTNMD